MRGRGGLDEQAHIGGAGCRHLRAAHSPCPRTVRLLMQQAVQQQPAVPFAASASCRGNHPGHDGYRRGADVRRREFRPAASAAESDTRSNPDFMWRIGPTYLGVRAGGGLAKSWSQRLRINGKPCNLGLGRYPIVTLAEARDKASSRRLSTFACPSKENATGRSPKEASRATASGLRAVSLTFSNALPLPALFTSSFADYLLAATWARLRTEGGRPRKRAARLACPYVQARTGRSAWSGRRSRSASGSSGARPTWTASERSGPW